MDLSNDMTGWQMIAVGIRRLVLARGELDRLEGPGYAARRTELRRKAKEAARTRESARDHSPRIPAIEQRADSSLTAAPFDAPRPEAARSLERVDAARPEPRGALGDPLVEAYGAAAIGRNGDDSGRARGPPGRARPGRG